MALMFRTAFYIFIPSLGCSKREEYLLRRLTDRESDERLAVIAAPEVITVLEAVRCHTLSI